MEFKDNLKKIREHWYFSLLELAIRIGVDLEEIEALEAGSEDPSDEIVSKLAAFFRVTKEELYLGLKEESLRPSYIRKN